jgi:peptide/nickel transport system substrate-binding protein
LAATGAAGLAMAGCGGGESKGTAQATAEPTGATGGTPKRGGTLRSASMTPILSLDPHDTAGAQPAPLFYGFIVQATDWQGTVGDLAESWEAPDGVNWVFNIRPGIRWQDFPPVNGRPFVADDIVKSLRRQNAMPGAFTDWDAAVDSYEAPDSATFTLRTKKPYSYLLGTVGNQGRAIVPVEAVDAFGDLTSHVIGTGPFQVKDYQPQQLLSVVRNPTYYQPFPYVDGLDVKVFSDEASVQVAFQAGALDMYVASNMLKADVVRDIEGVSVQTYLDRVYTVFVLNAAKFEAFKDERVREAVDLALDRKAMIDKLHFGNAELAGPIPPIWDSALPREEVEKAYTRDVAKARQLLSSAGQEGLRFSLSYWSAPDNADLATVIKSNLGDSGITAELKPSDVGTWLDRYLAGDFESTSFTHLRYMPDYIPLMSHHSHGYTGTDAGYLGVDDPEVDSMLESVKEAPNEDERISRAQAVQRIILKRHGPTLTLFQPYGYWAAYDYIKGYEPTAYGFGLFKYDYWIDKG